LLCVVIPKYAASETTFEVPLYVVCLTPPKSVNGPGLVDNTLVKDEAGPALEFCTQNEANNIEPTVPPLFGVVAVAEVKILP
jgi:hypothetical protein